MTQVTVATDIGKQVTGIQTLSGVLVPNEVANQETNRLSWSRSDGGTFLVLHDIDTIELLALPGIPALINTGRAELVAVRPLTQNSLRILLARAEHGRFRAIAATATIIERGCRNA